MFTSHRVFLCPVFFSVYDEVSVFLAAPLGFFVTNLSRNIFDKGLRSQPIIKMGKRLPKDRARNDIDVIAWMMSGYRCTFVSDAMAMCFGRSINPDGMSVHLNADKPNRTLCESTKPDRNSLCFDKPTCENYLASEGSLAIGA